MRNVRLNNTSAATFRRGFPVARRRFTLLILLFTARAAAAETADVERPEVVLLDVLAKPFVPLEGASQECLRDSAAYLEELGRYSPWALQMYDASAKIPAGVITGNYRQLGNYDECLRVDSRRGFVGQACSATVRFEISGDQHQNRTREPDLGDLLSGVALASNVSKWTSGTTVIHEWLWCVPSTCNHTEIQEALEIALDPLKVENRVDIEIHVAEDSCRTTETDRARLDVTDWIYIFVLSVFATIIIGSTAYDVAKEDSLNILDRKSAKHAILTSFSLRSNLRSLLRTERYRESIGCLDGLRYLSICWIIYGHTYYNEAVGVKLDLTSVPRMHQDWSKMLVLNGNIVTDTFFLLSGILLAYTEMSKKEKNCSWRFDVASLYIHRYLRLTPAYIMVIGFYATLLYKFGSGPHWESWVGANRNFCRENWWTNLLYINNYVNVPTMCMSQSWYLAADMQLVWLSPILLYPMIKFSQSIIFWIFTSLALIISMLIPFLITYFLQLSGTMLYYKQQADVFEVYCQIYTRVYTRAGPYIIGLALGVILSRTRSCIVKIPTRWLICGWIVVIVADLAVIVGPVGMYYDQHAYNRVEASFYAGMHRHVFALALGWIIFLCVHGYGGILNKFLSWNGWMPLSKLTYCAYLCHYIFLLSHSGSVRTVTELTTISVVYVFFGNLAFTMFLSLIWSLCFEMPFMKLDRALLSRRSQKLGLGAKPNQAKLFGSLDSGKQIYRLTEESSSTISQIYDPTNRCQSTNDSTYDSAENVSYSVNKENGDVEKIARTNTVELDNERPNCVYVIRENLEKDVVWPKTNPEETRTNYVEDYEKAGVNPGYDHDVTDDVNLSISTVDQFEETSKVDLTSRAKNVVCS